MPETHVIYTLAVSDAHLRVIGAALGELPYRIAAPVVAALQQQTDDIDRERAKVAAATAKAAAAAGPGPVDANGSPA